MSCAASDSLARRKGLLYNIGFVCLVGFSISLAGMSCVYVMRLHMSCGFVHCLVGLFTVLYVGDMSCAYVLQTSSFVYHACISCMYVMRYVSLYVLCVCHARMSCTCFELLLLVICHVCMSCGHVSLYVLCVCHACMSCTCFQLLLLVICHACMSCGHVSLYVLCVCHACMSCTCVQPFFAKQSLTLCGAKRLVCIAQRALHSYW